MLATTIHIELETFMKLDMSEMQVDPLKLADDMGTLVLHCQAFVGDFVKKAMFCSPRLSQLTQVRGHGGLF